MPARLRRNIWSRPAPCNRALPNACRGRPDLPAACATALDRRREGAAASGTYIDRGRTSWPEPSRKSWRSSESLSPRRPVRSPTTSPLSGSGQICLDAGGKLVAKGKLGGGISPDDGQKAARACAVNLLAQVKAALG